VKRRSVEVELRVGTEGEVRNTGVVTGDSALGCTMPLMFHYFANGFMKAAEGCKVTGDFPVVHCFLCCKSIELSLKAFLLAKNVPVSKLKKRECVGHDLEKALEMAESKGLVDIVEIPCHYKEELRKANFYYKKKGFEYFESYDVAMSIVDSRGLKVLSEFASMLVSKLRKVCVESALTLGEKSREVKYVGGQ